MWLIFIWHMDDYDSFDWFESMDSFDSFYSYGSYESFDWCDSHKLHDCNDTPNSFNSLNHVALLTSNYLEDLTKSKINKDFVSFEMKSVENRAENASCIFPPYSMHCPSHITLHAQFSIAVVFCTRNFTLSSCDTYFHFSLWLFLLDKYLLLPCLLT